MLMARGKELLRSLVWSLALHAHDGLIFLGRRVYCHQRRIEPSNVEGGKQSTLLAYHLSSGIIDDGHLDCGTDLRHTSKLFSSGRLRFIYLSGAPIGSCWAGATSYTQHFVPSVLILLVVYHNGRSRSMQDPFLAICCEVTQMEVMI